MGSLHLVGLRLAPPQQRIDAPSGASLLIPIPVQLGNRSASAAELSLLLPAGAQLEGTLTGPGMPATPLKGALATGLPVPALGAAGDYQITSIRVAKDGATLIDAPGQSVAIRCLGEVLISSVDASPMTRSELRDAGVPLGQGDYVGTRFVVGVTLGSNKVNLTVPVAFPAYNGVGELAGEAALGRLELTGPKADMIPDLQVALGNLAPPGNLTLARPEMAHVARYAFKSLVVIPGSIGYLHQFFKVNLVVLNALPKDKPEYTGYKVGKLTGTLAIPAAESSSLVPRTELSQSLHGDAGDSVGPGSNASGTWIVEGVREGSHLLEFQIQGEFTGGSLTGPVPILGTARTKVLVRNPSFDLLLVHPDVVRKGEVYTLEARLTNTSSALANGVSISLDQARLGNVRVVGSATQSVDTLRPGETASLKFTLRALRNGAVVASYLYSEAGGVGFQLATGLGERNVRLNPDTLVLPQTLDKLPAGLREAMLRVLGQAWSVATTKGALPPGVLPIRASTVTGSLADALTELGLFLSMGTGKDRVWAMLWRAFTQNGDPGFDQLVRATLAGMELRTELLKARSTWAGAGSLAGQLGTLASWNLEGEAPMLMAVEGAATGLQAAFIGADGSQSQGDASTAVLGIPWSGLAVDGGSMFFQNRFPAGGGQLRLRNGGSVNQDLRVAVASPLANPGLPPTLNTYHLVLPVGAEARVDLGILRGPPAAILLPGGGSSSAAAESTRDIQPEPFQILAVHRYDLEMDPNATPFGTQVMVLFNKPNTPVQLPDGDEGFKQGSAIAQVEGNALWRKAMPRNLETGEALPSPPAVVQALPRVVSIYLERPVGPYIPRRLTLSGTWTSRDGQSLSGGAFPILCGQIPGGATVKGKLRKPTGEVLAGKLTYWHLVSKDEGGLDLFSGLSFDEDYWALISNNIEVGADGGFQFDFVPENAKTARGVFTLEALTGGGKAFGSAAVLGNGQVIDLDVVLEGRGDVAGRLVDGQGVPLADVDVALYVEQSSGGSSLNVMESKEARTGSDGRFLLQGIKSGVFSMRFRKGDLGAARAGAVPAEGGRMDLGDIKLEAATGTIRVKVLNPDGSPRPNQQVLLGITAGLLRAGTQVDFTYVEAAGADAQGTVLFLKVPAGDVSAKLPYASGQGPAWYGFLKPGETQDATLKLLDPKQLARVAVVVKDSKGAPVSGAGLSLEYGGNPSWWVAITDLDGQAVVPTLPDRPFGVVVHHPDWAPEGVTSATVTPKSGESLVLPVTMPPRCFVKGRVTRPDGSPVAGAYVALPPVYSASTRNRMTRTGTDGQYRLAGLTPEHGERIACVGPDLDTAVNQAIQGQADSEIKMDLSLPFEGRNRLSGHVYQPGGGQLPAVADLEAYGQLPEIRPSQEGNGQWGLPVMLLRGVARSAADGSFRIDDLPSGPFLLQASSSFFPEWSKVNGAFQGPADSLVRDLTLVATFAGAMEGQVTLPDGQAKAPAGVRVSLRNGAIGDLSVETSANGRYAFAKVLPAGKYTLRAEDPKSGGIAVERLDLPRETNQIHNVRLWGTGKLTVHALDSLGRVLPDGVVTLSHSKAELLIDGDLPPLAQRLQPSSAGTLVWEALLEGQIRVELKDPNGLQGVASAEIPMGGGDSEVTVRLQPLGNLRGLLRRPDGSAVPAGRVDAYQGGRWLGLSNTRQDGIDGRFGFTGLPTGAISLEAWDPDTRQTGRATVQVLEGQTVELTLTTNDLGSVTFHVTKDRAAVDRATVQVSYQGGPALTFSAESTCDPQGSATFLLPPGDYMAQATDPVTLATGALSFTRSPGQGAMNVDLPLRSTRDLQVKVQAPKGWTGSLAGWKLRSFQGTTPTRVVTLDANGNATLIAMMANGYGLVLYDGSGCFRGSRSFTVTEGAGSQLATLQALARGSFEITLQDAHGVPVTNGRVQGYGPQGDNVSLQDTGTGLQGQVRYPSVLEGVLEADGRSGDGRFLAHGGTTLRAEGEVAALTLTLEPSARFQGTLTYAGGQPVPWTLVNYRADGRYVGGQLATDGSGRFASPPLPLGSYLLSANDGHGRAGALSVLLAAADQVAAADFSLGGSGTFQGKVSDPLRSPVPPVTVEVWQQNAVLASVAVDAGGAFQLKDLPSGRALDVKVRMDDGSTVAYTGSLTLQTDGATVDRDILLEPRPNLHGHTFAADGATHRSMTLRLYDPAAYYPVRLDATSVDHPTYLMPYLDPKVAYTLVAFDDSLEVARVSVQVQPSPVQQELDIRSKDITTVRGRIARADAALSWAAGSSARIGGLVLPLDPDGTLHHIGELLFDYSDQPLPVDVQASGGSWWHAGDVARVKNGITELKLQAPAFGSAAVTLLRKDGSPAAGGAVAIDGLGGGITGADGVWLAPVVRAGSYHVRANSSTEIGAGDFTLVADGQRASLTVKLEGLLDVSGTYTYAYAANVRLFQRGVQVEGDWWQNFGSFAPRTIAATLDGRVLRGTWAGADGSHGKFTITFAPDASSFTGTWGLNDSDTGNSWTANREAIVSVRLRPEVAMLKTGAALPFTVLVAGAADKAITWSAPGAVITPDGVYTAAKLPGLYTVTATSVADPSAKATTTLSVTPDGLPDVSGTYTYAYAANVRVFQKGDQVEGDWWQNFGSFPARTFTGTLVGLQVTGNWKDGSGAGGPIIFTFPIDASEFDAVWRTGADATGSSFHAYRSPGLSLRVKPGNVLMKAGGAQAFEALVAGSYDKQVAWSASGGSITPAGSFTAGGVPGFYTVTATSVADPAVKASVPVTAVVEGSLRVRFRTDAGRTLTGGTLTVSTAPPAPASPPWSATLQADGSYLASTVWVDQPLSLNATGFGLLKTAPAARIPHPADSLDLIWSAPDQGSLLGTVRGADGQPAVGATVTLDGGNARVTDATGGYRFDGLTVQVDHVLRAEGAGTSPEWVSATTRLAADAEQKTLDLKLPGTGTLIVTTRDRRGDPLPSAAVTVTTQNRQSPLRTLSTDAAGQLRLEGTMAAAVSVQATLEGRAVQASGVLAAGTTLTLDLKAPDATLVGGAIKRTGASALWPAGTNALLDGSTVALKPDGSLVATLDLLYRSTPITVEVQLPASEGGRRFPLGTVPMVKNGNTDLNLTAPPFGTVAVTVLRKDGSAAAAAQLQGDGGLRAVVDGAGKRSFPALDPGPRTFYAVAGDEAGQAAATLIKDGETSAITVQLGDRLDVSGRYLDNDGIDFALFQDGPRVFGDWALPGGGPMAMEGKLLELAFKGAVNDASGTAKGSFDTAFTPDGKTFAGTTYLRSTWSAVRKPGAAVKVEPAAAILRVSTSKGFRAFVAGIADKRVDWTASAGSVAADGTFSAPALAGPVTLTATSHGDPTQKATATVELRLPLTLSPASLVLRPGQSATVTATLTGVDPADLVWTASAGTLAPAGDHLSAVFTAPAVPGTATLSAASAREPTVKVTVPVIVAAGSITLSPASGPVYAGESIPVTATVTDLGDTTLSWTASAGNLSGTGLVVNYLPPYQDGPVTLTATSTSNPTVKGSATFQVLRRGRLDLRVLTADGTQIWNRSVTLSWSGGTQTQSLNANPAVFLNLPVGTPITLKDASADGQNPWAPPIPGQTFTLTSGEQKALNLTVPLGKLTLDFNRGGAALAGVQVGFTAGGASRYIPYGQDTADANGRFRIADMPLNVPIEGRFYSQGRGILQTFTLTQADTTLPIAWPPNKLTLRLARGGQPIAGATATLSGAASGSNLGPSDASGLLVISDLPLGAAFQASLNRGPVTLVRDITLTQAETTLDVEWPALAKVTVKLQRSSGKALPAAGWSWSASPGGEGAVVLGDGPAQAWPDLPQGTKQWVRADLTVMFLGIPAFMCQPSWAGRLVFSPSQAVETRTLTLPALASLRFIFRDKDGQALAGSFGNPPLTIGTGGGECRGPSIRITDFDQAVFPEIFQEGRYTFWFSGWKYGSLAPVTVTIGPGDDGKEIVVPVTLPQAFSQVAVKLHRSSGKALPTSGWQWIANPGGGGPVPRADAPELTWLNLPQGTAQQFTARIPLAAWNGVDCQPLYWQAHATLTPTHPQETLAPTLPALAALRFAFKDKQGQPLTGSTLGDTLRLGVPASNGNCPGPKMDIANFDQAVFPEVFPEGTYSFDLSSATWGPLDPVRVTVGPGDDGKELVVPVTLPWTRSTCAFKVLAGDHATPVPLAWIQARRPNGASVQLGSTGREATEASLATSFYGPEEDLSIQARFTPRRQAVAIASPPVVLRSGGTLQATLEIPLTVVRTQLLESDGSGLDGQGLLARGKTEGGDPDDCPTAVLATVRYGVLLGEPAASLVDLGLYDPDSGLGQRVPVTVPALGANLVVEKRLVPHAWLSGAAFTPLGAPPRASRLLLAASADAPELVNPASASWVLDGGRFAPLATRATFRPGGLQPGHSRDLDPLLVPVLANPPQPWTRTLAKVRLPLSGELWAGEWTLGSFENKDPVDGHTVSVTVSAQPGRWGHAAFTAAADEAKLPALAESSILWKATPLQVLDKDGKAPAGTDLANLLLAAWPAAHAPAGWWVALPGSTQAPADGGPDAQGLWHPVLPIGLPVHLENLPWTCGATTWWYGFLEFAPADPPPATTPLLKLQTATPLPPCIPAAPSSSPRGARR